MAKNRIRSAVAARRKAAATRQHKKECLGHATNSCIPKKVDNPNITINKEGKLVLDYNLDALAPYREIKAKWQKWNKEHYRGKRHSVRKKPWYTLLSGRCFNYEERPMGENGKQVAYFRVKSEMGKFYDRTIIPKMTRTKYNDLLIEAKLKDWEKKHPRPIPKDDAQKDLFEAQFMVPWVAEHTKARERIVEFVNNIGNRAQVYARYIGDTGYPHKIMNVRSDGKPFMIIDGKYNNYESSVINRVQRAANSLHENNPRLIALKVIEGSKECIVVPHIPLEKRLEDLKSAA